MSKLFRGVVRFEEAGRRLGHCSVEDRRVRGDGFGKVGLVYITRYNGGLRACVRGEEFGAAVLELRHNNGGLRACVRGEEFGAAVLELRHNDARDGNDADITAVLSLFAHVLRHARARRFDN